ncbi:hypothetical protein WJX81_008315 [Elliptochloris bilobata]|uniref:TLC domain-containing protein n=1 Tax=Elliptochloris bilobata TaxID=381761 RepID=A0AAW1QNA4_9CHLO
MGQPASNNSSFHSHICCLVPCAYVCLEESRGYSREQMVRGYTWAPDFYCRLFLGYLMYDLTSMLWHFKELGDPTAIIHHVIFASMSAYVLAHSIMAFPFAWLAFCEISTPSVNLRWHLAVTDHKDGWLYLYNGMLLLALFFVSRVLLYGSGLLHLATLRDVWAGPKANPNDKWVVAAFVAGYILNLYWFRAIAKAAQRALKRSKEA